MVLHFIGSNGTALRGRADPWIDKYIFPGALLPTLGEFTTLSRKVCQYLVVHHPLAQGVPVSSSSSIHNLFCIQPRASTLTVSLTLTFALTLTPAFATGVLRGRSTLHWAFLCEDPPRMA